MRYIFYPVVFLFFFACSSPQKDHQADIPEDTVSLMIDSAYYFSDVDTLFSAEIPDTIIPIPDTSELERQLLSQGLVNISMVVPDIKTEIKYSSSDNFMSEDVYEDFDECYLQPIVADMLLKAQSIIQEDHPRICLLIFDCVRPRSVQYKMWEIVKGTDQQKYVAPPGGGGSMHNYGAAVDLGLYHLDTGMVDMGTPFDYFGRLAQPRYETEYLRSGDLTQQQAKNRWLLREAMKKAGFHVILSEWWHFNAFPREEVRSRFVIVE